MYINYYEKRTKIKHYGCEKFAVLGYLMVFAFIASGTFNFKLFPIQLWL